MPEAPDKEFELERAVERLVVATDGAAGLQDDESLALLDLKTGRVKPVMKERQGRELVALFDGKCMLAFHEDDGLTTLDASGRKGGSAKLSGEAEFADARVLRDGQTAVLLIAEMKGPPLGLSVATYRFMVVNQKLATAQIDGEWSRWPQVWTVDESRGRLLVETEPGTGTITEFDLSGGKKVGELALPEFDPEAAAVTGLAWAEENDRLLWATFERIRRRPSLWFMDERNAEEVSHMTWDGAAGPLTGLSFCPAGPKLLFRGGSDGTSVSVVRPRDGGKTAPDEVCGAGADACIAWCGRSDVVVAEETKVRLFSI